MKFCPSCNNLTDVVKAEDGTGSFLCPVCGFSVPVAPGTKLLSYSFNEGHSDTYDRSQTPLDAFPRKRLRTACSQCGGFEVAIFKNDAFEVAYVCTSCRTTRQSFVEDDSFTRAEEGTPE